ncbi:hypothetical protein [Caloramator proteoclasticus]|uniref:Uncharacterized protein n=1 Tax=Caloramator proteoclasticus DSM 10124 TaxID=1121262 RepID=A0A1M5CB88_9CLOT|nr:hypothetical protein [Caloramator proteoclasticus]SHF51971.1 hypothetical protein SAMN02746091_02691 [Caloramator proteoclasticus DSM 10124]
MNVFQMKTKPHGIQRFKQFIEEGFVCIGWPGIGDLHGIDKDEIKQRLIKRYGYTGHELGYALGQVNAFVNTMQDGDIVIIKEKGWAYIGIVGEYVYEQQYDNDQDGMCHRRKVEWKNRILINELPTSLQKLLNNRNTISQYPNLLEETELDEILGKKQLIKKEEIEMLDNLFTEALAVLEEELKSIDPDRKLKAAIELIRLKNSKL